MLEPLDLSLSSSTLSESEKENQCDQKQNAAIERAMLTHIDGSGYELSRLWRVKNN